MPMIYWSTQSSPPASAFVNYAPLLIDGGFTATYYPVNKASVVSAMWDLDQPSNITRLEAAVYGDGLGGPSVQFQGSNDGTTWVSALTTVPVLTAGWNSINTTNVTSSAFQYFRLLASSDTDARIGHFRLFNGTSQYMPTSTVVWPNLNNGVTVKTAIWNPGDEVSFSSPTLTSSTTYYAVVFASPYTANCSGCYVYTTGGAGTLTNALAVEIVPVVAGYPAALASLASGTATPGTSATKNVITFNQQASLEQGRTYALVIRNANPSPASNYFNMTFQRGGTPPGNTSVVRTSDAGYTWWSEGAGYLPVALLFTNGNVWGPSVARSINTGAPTSGRVFGTVSPGIVFEPERTCWLSNAVFSLRSSGTPPGSGVACEVYVGNGRIAKSSNTERRNVGATSTNCGFWFDPPVLLEPGTSYRIVLSSEANLGDPSNYYQIMGNTSALLGNEPGKWFGIRSIVVDRSVYNWTFYDASFYIQLFGYLAL